MELRIVYILGTIVVMFHISEARPYLIDKPEADSEQDEIMVRDEIPNYMNTKDLSEFQNSELNSMEEISEKDKVNKNLQVPKSMTALNGRVKRGITKQCPSLCVYQSATGLILVCCPKRV
ncbi:hypothetical protein ACJMK2_011964 [Sinanodonta woodiana]|uniref:Uncharacterized protein n=1 Tax=Sinanodonta woodiana TaxID=1069815 RepID=A0ABD3V6N3_SINWO